MEDWKIVFKCPYCDECNNTKNYSVAYFDNEPLINYTNVKCKAPFLETSSGKRICCISISDVGDWKEISKSGTIKTHRSKRRIFDGRKFVRKKTRSHKHVAS